MFLNKLAALAALPLAVSLVGGAALAQSKEPVTIGAIEILTGPNNKYGIAIKNGFDLALESRQQEWRRAWRPAARHRL